MASPGYRISDGSFEAALDNERGAVATTYVGSEAGGDPDLWFACRPARREESGISNFRRTNVGINGNGGSRERKSR